MHTSPMPSFTASPACFGKRRPPGDKALPLAVPAICLLVIFLLSGCDIKRKYQAALLLGDIAAGQSSSLLKRSTPEPRRIPVAFVSGQRHMEGDLYRSPEGVLAGLLLVPGAAEEGRDDPRLVAFATSLARARFAVLVPELASLRKLQVHSGNINEVADAYAWLVSQAELAPQGRAGMVAFSYAAGPAVLAAMRPQLREKVRFILAVGGYYDLREVLIFFTTGYFRRDGQWDHRRPNAYGKWLFVLANAGLLENPEDRRILSTMARRRLDDPGAELEDLAVRLGGAGRRVYAFIVNRDPQRAPELTAALPEAIRAEIRSLNPALRDPRHLKARLLLVHGYDDPIIPHTQSIAFDEALPEEQARLYLVDGLVHVDIRPDWLGRWRLWQAVDALLAQREP